MSSSVEIDHLVCGAANLDRGSAFVHHVTGVKPTPGGRHPRWGSHNALVALGPKRYLEILAPDPLAPSLSPELQFLAALDEPRLVGWAAAANVDEVAGWLREAGMRPPEPQAGSRRRPDGALLEWQLLGFLTGSVEPFPFFIQWNAGSSHPSDGAAAGCALLGLELQSPEPDPLRSVLNFLGLDITAVHGSEPRIRARLETPAGVIELS